MRHFLIVALFIFCCLSTYAQCKDTAVHYFIKANAKFPRSALEKGIHGNVIVSFDIDSSCSIVNRQVTKGLGYGCDEAALESLDIAEERLKKEHNSKCCPVRGLTAPVKFKIQ